MLAAGVSTLKIFLISANFSSTVGWHSPVISIRPSISCLKAGSQSGSNFEPVVVPLSLRPDAPASIPSSKGLSPISSLIPIYQNCKAKVGFWSSRSPAKIICGDNVELTAVNPLWVNATLTPLSFNRPPCPPFLCCAILFWSSIAWALEVIRGTRWASCARKSWTRFLSIWKKKKVSVFLGKPLILQFVSLVCSYGVCTMIAIQNVALDVLQVQWPRRCKRLLLCHLGHWSRCLICSRRES